MVKRSTQSSEQEAQPRPRRYEPRAAADRIRLQSCQDDTGAKAQRIAQLILDSAERDEYGA